MQMICKYITFLFKSVTLSVIHLESFIQFVCEIPNSNQTCQLKKKKKKKKKTIYLEKEKTRIIL